MTFCRAVLTVCISLSWHSFFLCFATTLIANKLCAVIICGDGPCLAPPLAALSAPPPLTPPNLASAAAADRQAGANWQWNFMKSNWQANKKSKRNIHRPKKVVCNCGKLIKIFFLFKFVIFEVLFMVSLCTNKRNFNEYLCIKISN